MFNLLFFALSYNSNCAIIEVGFKQQSYFDDLEMRSLNVSR